jgi:hypothetical protein
MSLRPNGVIPAIDKNVEITIRWPHHTKPFGVYALKKLSFVLSILLEPSGPKGVKPKYGFTSPPIALMFSLRRLASVTLFVPK